MVRSATGLPNSPAPPEFKVKCEGACILYEGQQEDQRAGVPGGQRSLTHLFNVILGLPVLGELRSDFLCTEVCVLLVETFPLLLAEEEERGGGTLGTQLAQLREGG